MPQKAIVIWYVESDWSEWLKLIPGFIPTYAEWRSLAERQLQDMRTMGLAPEPITVRSSNFRRWAAANNKPRRADSVTAYLREKVNRESGTDFRRLE